MEVLNGTQVSMLCFTLRKAADRWEALAADSLTHPIAEILLQQAQDTRTLADKIERASSVVLS